MTLNDTEIEKRIDSQELLQGHHGDHIRNCGYLLTAGTVFAADSGDENPLGSVTTGNRHFWELAPSETLIVMTKEVVSMPPDLCASYGPLNRHARRGVMLLNPAIVEPCYKGPLSCFLVNFSSKRVQIAQGEPISKILFHQLNDPPSTPQRLRIDEQNYRVELSKAATLFHRSFLDVTGIEDRAASKAQRGLKNWAIGSGVFLAFSRWVLNGRTIGVAIPTRTHRCRNDHSAHSRYKAPGDHRAESRRPAGDQRRQAIGD